MRVKKELLPLWEIRGNRGTKKIRIRAADYFAARDRANRFFYRVEAIVLIEG
jgi:hypothetical protein